MRDDGEPGQTGDRDTPANVRDFKPAKQNGTRIRGTHQGQRACTPHKQAGHKTAPDHDAGASKSPCNAGAIHTGHLVARKICNVGRELAALWIRFRRATFSDSGVQEMLSPLSPRFVLVRHQIRHLGKKFFSCMPVNSQAEDPLGLRNCSI